MPTRKEINQGVPTVPPRVKSLVGMRFGRLMVNFYAGSNKHGKSMWCCTCDCNPDRRVRVPGYMLLGVGRSTNQKSCGCLRADPGIRRAARAKVPAKKRKEICDKMRKSVKNRKPAYSMDAHRAAELLGVSVERIEIWAKDGLLGYTMKRGALWVSSGDVSSLIGLQQRNKRICKVMDAWKMQEHEKAHRPK